MIKYDEEIFESDEEIKTSIIWYLVRKLGGKVEIPVEDIDTVFPLDRSLVMHKEDGKLYFSAERLDEVDNLEIVR